MGGGGGILFRGKGTSVRGAVEFNKDLPCCSSDTSLFLNSSCAYLFNPRTWKVMGRKRRGAIKMEVK